MKLINIVKRNPIEAAFTTAIAFCLLASSGNIIQNFKSMAEVRDLSQQNVASSMKLSVSQQFSRQQAEIAEARYRDGCIMVVASNKPGHFTSLTEGMPVLDPVRKTTLPVGTIVCDSAGNTATLTPGMWNGKPAGIASEFAFTGNQEIVKQAASKVKAIHHAPNQ